VSVALGVGVVEPGPGDDEQDVRVARANKASERPLAPAALDLQTSDMLTSHLSSVRFGPEIAGSLAGRPLAVHPRNVQNELSANLW
jgi:hypothetical protein